MVVANVATLQDSLVSCASSNMIATSDDVFQNIDFLLRSFVALPYHKIDITERLVFAATMLHGPTY